MSCKTGDAPLTIINEAAIAAAELRHDPYDYCFVDDVMPPSLKEPVLNDAPTIPDRGSYGLPDLKYGPNFGKVIDELLSERFRGLVEKKFDIDLSQCPPCIVMMGNTVRPATTRATRIPTPSTRSSPCWSASVGSGRTSAASCACCAATTATTSPSNTPPNTARC